jgi:uncharacterized alpha-E superfamily protein
MLSRVADFLFWLGRYVERSETLARVLDVNYTRAVDLYSSRDGRSEALWRSVMHSVGFVPDPVLPQNKMASTVLGYVAFDETNPSSIVSGVRIARSNALGVRSELSTEVWESINMLYLFSEEQNLAAVMREGPSRYLRRVRDMTQAFAGTSDATMTHGEGWSFLQVGRFLERAFMTARILAAVDVENEPWHESQRLLEMCCAGGPFAQHSHRAPEARDALEFIVLSADCPRSLRYCAREVDSAMHRISRSPDHSFTNAAERRLGRLRSFFDFTSIDEIVAGSIRTFAERQLAEFELLSSEIEQIYFPRQLVGA